MQRVIELLASYNPRLTNLAPVQQWIGEGADLELDILPVLKEWTARKKDIYSLGFFAPYVRQARDARQATESQKPASIHLRAKAIAYLTRSLGRKMPSDERWLEAYEARYGRIG